MENETKATPTSNDSMPTTTSKKKTQIRLLDIQSRLKDSKANLIFMPLTYDELIGIKKTLDDVIESKKAQRILDLEAELELLKKKY
jgi:hypothetical protein